MALLFRCGNARPRVATNRCSVCFDSDLGDGRCFLNAARTMIASCPSFILRMRRPWLVMGELALCLMVSSASAVPAEPSPQELALVRELWERAVAAQEQADWAACEQALAEAVPIVETPGLRFNLAYCREMQTKWVEALVDYKL